MRGASVDVSVMGASPFLCYSAQTEEGKNGHDDHDETDKIDDAVHDFLHECDGLSTDVAPCRSTLSGRCRPGGFFFAPRKPDEVEWESTQFDMRPISSNMRA
jgi:hypothetical protein